MNATDAESIFKRQQREIKKAMNLKDPTKEKLNSPF